MEAAAVPLQVPQGLPLVAAVAERSHHHRHHKRRPKAQARQQPREAAESR